MRYSKIVISLLLLLACPLMASAATYYVRTGGNDSHSCSQAQTDNDANAKASIQAGVNCATGPGDVVSVHAGTYGSYGSRLLMGNASGSNLGAGAITLRAFGDGTVWHQGAFDMFEGTAAYWVIDGINFDGGYAGPIDQNAMLVGSHTIVKNVEAKNFKHYGVYGTADTTFINVVSHGHGTCPTCWCHPSQGNGGGQCHGFYMHDSPYTLDRCEAYEVHGQGVSAVYDVFSGNTSTIQNSKFHHCVATDCAGIQIINTNGTVNIINNLMYNNNGSGAYISTGGASNRTYNFFQNTVFGNGAGLLLPAGLQSGAVRNNILYQTGSSDVVGTWLDNLTTNPVFQSAAGGDFHINAAGSPAVGGGPRLSSVLTDAEGLARANPTTLGAYEFTAGQPPPNPDPGTIVATYTFDAGTGTTVADATGGGHTGTWSECAGNACWTTGIIGPYAGNFNGTRYVEVTNTTGMKPTGAIAMTGWIKLTGTGVDGCDVASMGDSAKIHVEPNGNVSGTFYDGTTWREPFSSGVNALNGLAHFLGMSYNGTDVRVYLDGNQVAFQAATGTITYTLGANFEIGRHGFGASTYGCTGVIDQVSLFNGFCDAQCMLNLYNSQVPVVGMSIAHMGWFATGTPVTQLGATDTDRTSHLITTPLAFGFGVRKADAGSLTEYLKPVCIVNTGAGFPAWTSAVELTNSFAPTGIRYYADAAVSQGQATSVLLPTDTFTGVNGLILKSPIDTTSPYDAAQRLTIAAGQQADMLYEVEFGSPLVGGNSVQCRLVRENGADFDSYANIKTVTLLGISPPTSVQIGGIGAGGVQQ